MIDYLIQDKWQGRLAPDREAFFVGQAGLFDVDIELADCSHDPHGVMHAPTCIRISHQTVAAFEAGRDGMDPFDVDIRVAADFELKAPIALGPVGEKA